MGDGGHAVNSFVYACRKGGGQDENGWGHVVIRLSIKVTRQKSCRQEPNETQQMRRMEPKRTKTSHRNNAMANRMQKRTLKFTGYGKSQAYIKHPRITSGHGYFFSRYHSMLSEIIYTINKARL